MTNVILRREVAVKQHNLNALHPLLQRIYLARAVITQEETTRELANLLLYHQLKNIEAACARLKQAIEKQQRIVIVGDFDADGATSSALAVAVLQRFGAKEVSFLVPNRFTDGYGLTPNIVELAHHTKAPNLIITVDNGIASLAGVAKARALDIDVIITDHHLPGESVPEDCIIVNPNQAGDQFASKCLAGVGVIFYVMVALRAYLRDHQWFKQRDQREPNLAEYLDLVALGTVADVVPLDRNNRILVYQGLQRIRSGHVRPGIAALLQVSGCKPKSLKASDLGFLLGPRLNAAGRLEDMATGIHCLLAERLAVAMPIAAKLDELNRSRKSLEMKMRREAFAAVDKLNLAKALPYGLCLYQEDWHQGVVGLVASKVKDNIHRPVIAFAKADEQTLKGSARSVPGLHIRDVLARIAAQQPSLIDKFGGHAMAAGLSLPLKHYADFAAAFATEVGKVLTEDDIKGRIYTDGELLREYFSLEIAELLLGAGPWGQGFPEPLFDGEFILLDQRIVGQRHLKMTLKLPGSDKILEAIAFQVDLATWPNYRCEKVRLVYRLDINEYNMVRRLQLLVERLWAVSTESLEKELTS